MYFCFQGEIKLSCSLTVRKLTNKDQERTWAKLNSVYLALLYMAIKLLWFIDFFLLFF